MTPIALLPALLLGCSNSKKTDKPTETTNTSQESVQTKPTTQDTYKAADKKQPLPAPTTPSSSSVWKAQGPQYPSCQTADCKQPESHKQTGRAHP